MFLLQVLSSASSLDRHVLVHTGERPFTCKYCNVTFTTNGNMHRHMRTHKRDNTLINTNSGSNCGGTESYESDGSSDSGGSSRVDLRRAEKRKSSADTDDSVEHKRRLKTINNNNILNGLLDKEEKIFCCIVCERNDFPTMTHLTNHLDKEHQDVPAKCKYCGSQYKSHAALNSHKCTMNNNPPNVVQGFKDLVDIDFTCDKFPTFAKAKCEQTIRTSITNQNYECPKCYCAFPCIKTLEIHSRDCSATNNKLDNLLGKTRNRQLSETSEEDLKRDEFFNHLDLKNRSTTGNSLNTSSANDSLSSSHSVDLSRFDINKLGQHRYPYNHDQKDLDLADIPTMLKMASYGSVFHNMMTPYPGDISKDLNNQYPEEEAQDAFTAEFRKMKLRGEFPCKLCTAVFPNLRALKGHNRIHVSDAGPSGPYRCNMCPYTINDKSALTRHMRTHNGDRPYECAICNYAFTTKANCERHLRNRHAMSTRDEVKNAIIYHPSEDANCDDPTKKMSMLNSPDFDDDEQLPKDRSTPISQLKEILMPSSAERSKIQVKSIDKLTEPNGNDDLNKTIPSAESKPMDLSMDALDLSRKNSLAESEDNDTESLQEKLQKSQQLLFSQMSQQFLNGGLPLDAPYMQLAQLYRMMLPSTGLGIPPMMMPGAFDLKDLQRAQLPFASMFPMFMPPTLTPPSTMPSQFVPTPSRAETHTPNQSTHSSPHSHHQSPTQLPPTPQRMNVSNPNQSPGPVKMVIKNGVLMPKQKQRRYRTERPFRCEHCSACFTLRSNMERHIKQQHPQYWAQRHRGGGHNVMRRGSGGPLSMPPNMMPAIPNMSDQMKYAILMQHLNSNEQKFNDSNDISGRMSPPPSDDEVEPIKTETPHTGHEVDDEPQLVIDEDSKPEDLSGKLTERELFKSNESAQRVAQNILQEVLIGQKNSKSENPQPEIKRLLMKDEHATNNDLVSVSKLVDNATNHSVNLGSYFKTDIPAGESDEEGLVASGSASDHSGAEDHNPTVGSEQKKKKSAYSLAPNRVSCTYCPRTFPWSSSLRRHILTHTGQKPFKCSKCPLLFTTKSNCDRHLQRKHGNVEDAMSLYIPIDEMPEPQKTPAPKQSEIHSTPTTTTNSSSGNNSGAKLPQIPITIPTIRPELQTGNVPSAELPFKCHLCDGSFPERVLCLEHIRSYHAQDYELLMEKGAIEAGQDNHGHTEDEERQEGRGKYPDYANRKVICAFCVRRFWSTEDLRRHMRTHSGERPFECQICKRKFTLKHSMLRHQKKHTNNNQMMNSGSDVSDDEQSSMAGSNIGPLNNNVAKIHQRIPDLIHKDLFQWRSNSEQKENISLPRKETVRSDVKEPEDASDLIGNLLGISDQGILNKVLLSSPDEAAKLLGVEK